MATVKCVVRLNRINKNNQVKVEIAICHKGVTHYIEPLFDCDVFLRGGKIASNFQNGNFTTKEKDYIIKNTKINEALMSWQGIIDKIGVCDLSPSELVRMAKSMHDHTRKGDTIIKAANDYAKLKQQEGRKKNAEYVLRAVDVFVEYMNGDVRMSDISLNIILDFEAYLRTKRKGNVRQWSDATVSSMLARIKAVINHSIRYGLVRYEIHPFAATKIKASRVRDSAIDVEYINKYARAHIKEGVDSKARDVWFLSFWLGGVNFKDIYEGRYVGDEFIYIRSKTADRVGDEVRVPVLPQAHEIINKYIGDDGRLNFGYKFTNYDDLMRFFARRFRTHKSNIGLPQCFSFMSARKSWAQIACEAGVSDSVIDYVLGHSQNTGGVLRYYRRITPKQVKEAMMAVYDALQ